LAAFIDVWIAPAQTKSYGWKSADAFIPPAQEHRLPACDNRARRHEISGDNFAPRQPVTRARWTGKRTPRPLGSGIVSPLGFCAAANCLQDWMIIKSIPVSKNPRTPSIKTTLQEKLALIPPTPEPPATLDGSLHPSHARTDGK